jgi:hypothetical protein
VFDSVVNAIAFFSVFSAFKASTIGYTIAFSAYKDATKEAAVPAVSSFPASMIACYSAISSARLRLLLRATMKSALTFSESS